MPIIPRRSKPSVVVKTCSLRCTAAPATPASSLGRRAARGQIRTATRASPPSARVGCPAKPPSRGWGSTPTRRPGPARRCPMANPILDTARQLVAAGVSVIPMKADGSKAPASTLLPIDTATMRPVWEPYQRRIAHDHELVHWFSKPHVGIATVAGEVSGNLEILDIDEPALVRPWYEMVEQVAPGLVSRLVVVKTPREGYGRHCYYRSAVIEGNTKLAQGLRPDVQDQMKVATLIETRGQGGYCLVPPSPAQCHPLNRPYVLA